MSLTALRRRRGAVRGSITRIKTKLQRLREEDEDVDISSQARQMAQRLEALIADFTSIHYSIAELLDSEEEQLHEQTTLDETEEEVMGLLASVENWLSTANTSANADKEQNRSRTVHRRLIHLQRKLFSICEFIDGNEIRDACLLKQYEVEITSHKQELTDLRLEILALELNEEDELYELQSSLEDQLFDLSLRLRRADSRSIQAKNGGVKLPKLDVPTFDGNIINWQSFWEQYEVSVHSREITNAEKLVYLQQSL